MLTLEILSGWCIFGFIILLLGFLFTLGFAGFKQFKNLCFINSIIFCWLGPFGVVVPFILYLWEKHVL